jgi:hypothetical protein
MNSPVDKSANDDDVYDDGDDVRDEPSESRAKPRVATKPKDSKGRGGMLLLLIAIVAAVFGLYEFRRAEQLATQVSNLTTQNTTMQNQIGVVEQNLQSATERLNEVSKEKMPVAVFFRPNTREGLSAYFKNNAPEPITVSVLLTNPVTNRRRESNMTIPANGVVEIGDLEGWVFAPGHHVMVTHAQFGSVEYVVSGP